MAANWTPWRLAGLALALDIAFVVVWWALVYRPGEQLFAAREADPLRWGDARVEEVRVLAPGSHALLRVGDRWHLLAASDLAPGDLQAAAAAPGAIVGELEAAVFLPEEGAAVVVEREGGRGAKAWTWPLGQTPKPLAGPVPEAPWITRQGELRDRRELKPSEAEDGVVYAGDVMVVLQRRGVVVLSRDDGEQLDAWGKVDQAFPRPESEAIVYETGVSSLPKIRTCDGTDCTSHGLTVGWRYDASSAAFRADGDLFAACREGEVILFVPGEVRGLYLGTLEGPDGCEHVGWLPGGELMVQGDEGVSLWRVSPARGRET